MSSPGGGEGPQFYDHSSKQKLAQNINIKRCLFLMILFFVSAVWVKPTTVSYIILNDSYSVEALSLNINFKIIMKIISKQ